MSMHSTKLKVIRLEAVEATPDEQNRDKSIYQRPAPMERFQIESGIEKLGRFKQFKDRAIYRIKEVGNYLFCFRQDEQLPMVYPVGSSNPLKAGKVEAHNNADNSISEIAWCGVKGDNLLRLSLKEWRKDFDNKENTVWAPFVSPEGKGNHYYKIDELENGTVQYTLTIPGSNFKAHYDSGDNRPYNKQGILTLHISPNGEYKWNARHHGANELAGHHFGTIGVHRKHEFDIGEEESKVRVVLEMNKEADMATEEGVIRIFDEETKKEIVHFTGSDVSPNPLDPNELLIVIKGQVHAYGFKEKAIENRRHFKLPSSIKKVHDIAFEPRGNFIVVLHNDSNTQKDTISIINYVTGEIVSETRPEFKCSGPLTITKGGEVIFQEVYTEKIGNELRKQYRMRSISTNMGAYQKGEAQEIVQKEVEIAERIRKGIKEGGIEALMEDFDEEELQAVDAGTIPQMVAAEKELSKAIEGMIQKAMWEEENNAKKIEAILAQVLSLSRKSDYTLFTHVFEPHINHLRSICDELRSREINKELQHLTGEAAEIDVKQLNGDALAVLDRLSTTVNRIDELLKEGQRLQGSSKIEIASEVIERRIQLKESLDKIRINSIGAMSAKITDRMKELIALAKTIDDAFVLEQLWKSELVQNINHDIQSLPDVDLALTFTEKLKSMFDKCRQRINREEDEKRNQKEEEYKKLEAMAEMQLEEIGNELKQMKTENEIQEFRLTSHSIKNIEATLAKLPQERARLLAVKLEDELASAINYLEAKQHVTEFEGNVAGFGKVTFPIFSKSAQNEVELWKLSPVRTANGEIMMQLKSTLGRTEDLPEEVLLDPNEPLIMSRQEYMELAKDKASYLRMFLINHPDLQPNPPERNVPAMSEKWEHTDHVDKNLEKFARALMAQRRNQEGITILEGEAGTGKNVLIDMFAHHTNREIFIFSCNAKTDKEDLTRFYDYDPVRGTYRLNSMLVDAIQTPGAILVLDEINTLPPEVAKMLNNLLDYNRKLNLTEGGKFGKKGGIKADKEVLLAGTMNPQNYAGVQKLSPELVSRSRVVRVDYPELKDEDGNVALDEVLIYRKYIPTLNKFTRQQFTDMWNAVVNNGEREPVDALLDRYTEETLRDLKILVVTANKFRKAYMDYKLGKEMEEMDFVFSLREGCNIAQEYAQGSEMKEAVREVVLPKIWDEQTRQRVDQAIIAQV